MALAVEAFISSLAKSGCGASAILSSPEYRGLDSWWETFGEESPIMYGGLDHIIATRLLFSGVSPSGRSAAAIGTRRAGSAGWVCYDEGFGCQCVWATGLAGGARRHRGVAAPGRRAVFRLVLEPDGEASLAT